MTSPTGTIRLYRPDPRSIRESKRCGRANFSVHPLAARRIRIAACGDVDAVNGRNLGHYVETHTGSSQQLILDLRAVDFFGTAGFTALYYISVQCARRDIDWVLVGSPPVRKMLQICDNDGELPLCADIESASVRLNQAAQYRRRVASAG